MELLEENHTINDILNEIKDWFKINNRKINYIDTVFLIFKKQVITIKK